VIANVPQRLTDRQPTYTIINIGLGWRRPDGLMSIRGFVNNVFNINYATNMATQPGNYTRFFNDPRMAGVRVRMDF
jgi:outer membrane receptor protein involved in Fe transport